MEREGNRAEYDTLKYCRYFLAPPDPDDYFFLPTVTIESYQLIH